MRIPDDRPRDECGVVGVYTPNEQAAREAFFGTYALQHRGQESVGIASADGEQIRRHTAMGLLVQGFQETDLQRLTGHIAIGHTRYSTTGSNLIQNAQPMTAYGPGIEIAVGHNGNLVNAVELRDELAGWGIEFHTSSDTEVLANIIANAPANNWADRVAYAMRRVRGAYSMVGLTRDFLLAMRDPLGVRPLCIGKLNGDGWVFASETCALDHIGADFVREVAPGEAIIVDENGLRTLYKRETNGRKASCVFEHIYFARPDSVIDGRLIYASRMEMGRELAREHPVDADMVIGVPDSATAAAAGYSQESGIPYGDGFVKNRYVGRTFILPDQRLRDLGVRTKLNPLPDMIRGKKLVVVEDSIVRGTTSVPVVNLLRKGGAREVHLRICAPPIMHPCQLGIDMPTRRELIASSNSVDEICAILGADSLGYLSHDGLVKAVDLAENRICSRLLHW